MFDQTQPPSAPQPPDPTRTVLAREAYPSAEEAASQAPPRTAEQQEASPLVLRKGPALPLAAVEETEEEQRSDY